MNWTSKAAIHSKTACCCISALLTACGGNPGGGGVSGGSQGSDPNAQLVNSGYTTATYLNKEWLTVLTSDVDQIANWYALHFASDDPDLYSGKFSGIGTTTLSSASVSYFQNLSSQIRLGTGSITSSTAGQLNVVLSFPSVGVDPAKSISVSPSRPLASTYLYESAALLSNTTGNWTGRLSYGLGSVTNYTLSIDANGTITGMPTFMQDCRMLNGSLKPYSGSVNLYQLKISFDNTTQCLFRNKALSGVGLILNNPVAGKSQRLQLIAVTNSGEGMSFRADK